MPKSTIHTVLLLVFLTLLTQNSLVLGSTVEETIAKRADPLRIFKQYGGDYDISNKHYWASAAFTGIHGYAVAGVWLLSGIGFGSFILLKNSCGGGTVPIAEHSNSSYRILLLLIVLFTIFAITASCVVIAANEKSQQRTKELEETIFGAGKNACQTIEKVNATFIHMQTSLCQYDSKTCYLLKSVTDRLQGESVNIQSSVDRTKHPLDQAIQNLYVVNLVVSSANLLLLVSGLAYYPADLLFSFNVTKFDKSILVRLMDCCFGSVLLALHHRPGILVLIFCCWILTTLSWIMTGIDFFFDTFIKDTCSTLRNFKENPQNNSLANMLPCPKLTDSDEALVQIGNTVHSFIVEINSKISEMRAAFVPNEQNDGLSFQEVCDPFSTAPHYTYSPENCGKNSIAVGDLPNVLSKYICYEGTISETCLADGRFIPQVVYLVTLAYSRSIQELINVYPDMSSLVQCSSVNNAVSDIVMQQCKPIRLSAKVLWSSMLSLSTVMVILVLLWSVKAIKDRGR